MCGRRRQNRAPALVVLGKMAYDKYQERKTRQIEPTGSICERSPSPELLEEQANSEILEKAGIPPPSYEEVVVNRVEIPNSYARVSEKEVKGDQGLIDDLTYPENLHGVPNGLRAPNAYRAPTQPIYVHAPVRSGCCGRQNYGYSSRWEQKRAEKIARKAEKHAAKLVKSQPRM